MGYFIILLFVLLAVGLVVVGFSKNWFDFKSQQNKQDKRHYREYNDHLFKSEKALVQGVKEIELGVTTPEQVLFEYNERKADYWNNHKNNILSN